MDSKLKGNSEGHIKRKEKYLRALANQVNLFKPKEVTLHILNAKNKFHPDKSVKKKDEGKQKKEGSKEEPFYVK